MCSVHNLSLNLIESVYTQMIRVSPTKSILSLSEPAVVETKQSVNLRKNMLFSSPWTLNALYIYIFRIVLACVPPMFHQTYHHNNVDWKPISQPLCRPNEKPRKGCYEHCEADIYGILLLDPFREYQNLFFSSREIQSSAWKVLWAAVNCSLTGSYWRHWLRLLDMHVPKKLLMKGPYCV